MMPCANGGSKPWCRCGFTDDTRRRLGDAGSMTFLPWFVPRTEPPVQLREVGPDRGHLLTESYSDVHLHVCRCRTGDVYCCCCCSVLSRRQNITACTVALSLLDRGCFSNVSCSSTGCCSSTCCLLLLLLLRCSSTRRWWSTGSHPIESLVEQNFVMSTDCWLCISWAESSCPTESSREKTDEKTTINVKKHISVCICIF